MRVGLPVRVRAWLRTRVRGRLPVPVRVRVLVRRLVPVRVRLRTRVRVRLPIPLRVRLPVSLRERLRILLRVRLRVLLRVRLRVRLPMPRRVRLRTRVLVRLPVRVPERLRTRARVRVQVRLPVPVRERLRGDCRSGRFAREVPLSIPLPFPFPFPFSFPVAPSLGFPCRLAVPLRGLPAIRPPGCGRGDPRSGRRGAVGAEDLLETGTPSLPVQSRSARQLLGQLRDAGRRLPVGEEVPHQLSRRPVLEPGLDLPALDPGQRAGTARVLLPARDGHQPQGMRVRRVTGRERPLVSQPVPEQQEQPEVDQRDRVPVRPVARRLVLQEQRHPLRRITQQLGGGEDQRVLDLLQLLQHARQPAPRQLVEVAAVELGQPPGCLLGLLLPAPAAVREPEALPHLQRAAVTDQDVADRAGPAAPVGGGPALDEQDVAVTGQRAHDARPGRRRTGHPQQRAQFPAQFLGTLGVAGTGDGVHAGALAAVVAVPPVDDLLHRTPALEVVH